VGLILAGMNVGMALASGAGFEQTALNTGIGLGVGVITGGLGQGLDPVTSLLMGSASASVTTMISTP